MLRADTTGGLEITALESTAFTSTVHMKLPMEEPLAARHVPAIGVEDLKIGELEVRSVNVGLTADRQTLTITLRAAALPPGTSGVAINLQRYYIVPPEGNGIPAEGPFTAHLDVDSTAVPSPQVADIPSEGIEVETGFGWSYVIERIEYDDYAVKVDYRVEGDVETLEPYVDPDQPPLMLPFAKEGGVQSHFAERPAADSSVEIEFGPAVRVRPDDAQMTVQVADIAERGSDWRSYDWLDETIVIAGQPVSTDAFAQTSAMQDGPHKHTIVFRVASQMHLGDTPAAGRTAELVDDLGNTYELLRTFSNVPVSESGWVFVGPVAPGASELHFSLAAVGAMEEPAEQLVVDLEN